MHGMAGRVESSGWSPARVATGVGHQTRKLGARTPVLVPLDHHLQTSARLKLKI